MGGQKTLKRLEPKLNKLQNNWNIWTDLQYNITNQNQAQAICRNWRGKKEEPNTSPHHPRVSSNINVCTYICVCVSVCVRVAEGKLNGKFACEKNRKKLMPRIRKNVLSHSYPVLSHERDSLFTLRNSHFSNSLKLVHLHLFNSLVKLYFLCHCSNRGVWTILYLISGSSVSNDCLCL